MTNQTNSDVQGSKTSTILLAILGIIIVGLLAVIIFLILNNNNAPDTGGEVPPEIELPAQLPSGPTVTAIEAINVRSGPSTDYPSYGVAPAGSVAAVIGISADGGWWAITIPTNIAANGQGWVSAEFVQADNIGEPPIIEAPTLP
jgi:uncharacterized protein YgiM (DUF1202 family)